MNETLTSLNIKVDSAHNVTIYIVDIKYKYDFKCYNGETLLNNAGHKSISIYYSPTGNCQLSTLATFANIQSFKDDDLLKIFKFIYDKAYVKLLLFDINKEYVDRIEQLFSKKYISFKTEYISTNKSKMCMFGINIAQFIKDIFPKKTVKIKNIIIGNETTKMVESKIETPKNPF